MVLDTHTEEEKKRFPWKALLPLVSLGMAAVRDFRRSERGIAVRAPALKAEIESVLTKLRVLEERDADTARQIAGVSAQLKTVSAGLDSLTAKVLIAVWIAAAALVTALIAMLFAVFR